MVEPGGESKRQSFESQRSKVTQWRTQAEAIGPGCSNSWPGPTRWIFSDYRPGGKSSSSSGSVQEKGNASASRLSRYRGVLAGGAIATATAARRPLALSPQTRAPASIRVAPAPAPVARPGGGLGARAVPHAAAAAGEPLLPGARGGVGVRGAGRRPHQPGLQDLRGQRPLPRRPAAGRPRRARAAAPRRLRGRLLDMALHHPARLPGRRDHRRRQRDQPQVPASAYLCFFNRTLLAHGFTRVH